MSKSQSQFLNDSHYQTIRNALTVVIPLLEREIALGKQAGIDMSAVEAQLVEDKKKLLAIKNVYFPGQ